MLNFTFVHTSPDFENSLLFVLFWRAIWGFVKGQMLFSGFGVLFLGFVLGNKCFFSQSSFLI
jgi:hypothetical protein